MVVDAEDGGTKAIKAKDKQRVVMIKMYTQLGHYAESACNDDPAIFSTSGFTPVSSVKTAAKPLTEAKFRSVGFSLQIGCDLNCPVLWLDRDWNGKQSRDRSVLWAFVVNSANGVRCSTRRLLELADLL